METLNSPVNASEQLPISDWIIEQIMRPSFEDSKFLDIECSFDSSAGGLMMKGTFCSPDFNPSSKHCVERNINGRKRKTESESVGLQLAASSGSDAKVQKDACPESIKSSRVEDEKKEKKGDSYKGEYIHVRAKRGQATNSHSLAERVRREKISERMRVLQDLVPGCNKISGKAVMLDEIINYVQSLQRQVEFLSMKLSAVHPELNSNIEQIFSKDVHQLGGNPTHLHGALMANTMHQLPSISQMANAWEEELQNAVQMAFNPHHTVVYTSGMSSKDHMLA